MYNKWKTLVIIEYEWVTASQMVLSRYCVHTWTEDIKLKMSKGVNLRAALH